MTGDDYELVKGEGRSSRDWIGVDRSEAAREVLARLEAKSWHVHVEGPPGFGKREIADALARRLQRRAVIVRLDQSEPGVDPLRLVWEALAKGAPLSERWPEDDWSAGWDVILRQTQRNDGERRVLVVLGAERLVDGSPLGWPEALSTNLDLVTISLAPLHLIAPAYSQADARARTVLLRAFPPPEVARYDEDPAGTRRDAQQPSQYLTEGRSWLERYFASRDGSLVREAAIRRVFEAKHEKRLDEIWDGHPLINMVVLEDMLDFALAENKPSLALARWRENLPGLAQNVLGSRLLPFSLGQRGAVSPFVAEAVAEAVAQMAGGAEVDPDQRQWLLASGLSTATGVEGRLVWSHTAQLISRKGDGGDNSDDAMLAWARMTLLSARQARRAVEQRHHDRDHGFRAAMDRVEAMFCETGAGTDLDTRVERSDSRVIVPGRVYSFRLSFKAKSDEAVLRDQDRADPTRPSYDILVFETADEGLQFWKHQIRILAMLGRMRHPSLVAFARGGILRHKDDIGEINERVYVKVDRVLEWLPTQSLRELAAVLPGPMRESGPGDGMSADRQIADLAEALELIHAQGIIHRALDFGALAIDRNGGHPQLVLTGFEYSANLRSEILQRRTSPLATYRRAVWNLACRAPEVGFDMGDEIDPSVDVYSFGALAIMLATGLPDLRLLDEIDRSLPIHPHARSSTDMEKDGAVIERAVLRLRENLLDGARWPDDNEALQRLRRIISPCLELDPGSRPTMEDVAPRLKGWHSDNEAARVRPDDVLYVTFAEREMGQMLKNLKFIDQDVNLETPEGRAFLQTRLQGWINSARWMHFRESGFPGQGAAEAAYVRREARYVLAGKNVVFFASVFRPTSNAPPDPTFLWLAYAVRRDYIWLPDPDDNDLNRVRDTTEEQTWLPRPAQVRVIPRAEIHAVTTPASWQPTLRELETRGKLTATNRLGREAATVWRLHRDILLATEAIRNFPVIVEQEHGSEPDIYKLTLDEDAYRNANESGSLSFLREVLVEGKNLRAYFADTVQGLAEDESATQIGLILHPRGAVGYAPKRRIAGSIILPVRDNNVLMKVTDRDDGPMPGRAYIRWLGSFGTQTAIERQTAAIERLERRTWLMDLIVTPRDGDQLLRPISNSFGGMLNTGQERIDELRERVRVLLSSDPLHAVQGPPGTGKTTLIAALVAEVLAGEDGSRILITSQSHAATDNVLLSVMDNLKALATREEREDWLPPPALRLFSDSTRESVDSVVRQRHSIDAQVRAALERMQARADAIAPTMDGWLKKAYEFLGRAARGGYFEVRFKIERSSPLVFATTGAAMTSADYMRRGAIGFDYVLIDEAARAFSIDLVQPMALADRAIWVGDQAQLPPFGETDLTALLETAARRHRNDNVPPDIAYLLDRSREEDQRASAFERMTGWLKLFHRIFEECPPSNAVTANHDRVPVTQALDRQFRSVEAIGRLVADTFYPNIEIKQSGPDPDPTSRLSIRVGGEGDHFSPAVAWIDTSAMSSRRFFSRSAERGRLENEGEADIVKLLLKDFSARLKDGDDPWERLRILSPYRAQVGKMYQGFDPAQLRVQREELPRMFQTVDSAQGSEADIVLLSFSRRFDPQPFDGYREGQSTASRIGHLKQVLNRHLGFLQQPERINVMMSRARQQIILLGDFEYFRRGADLLDHLSELENEHGRHASFWTTMLSSFEPFDVARHLRDDGSERPVILPAELIQGVVT